MFSFPTDEPISELVSMEEAISIAANYHYWCNANGIEYDVQGAVTLIQEFAYSRQLCGLFHQAMHGEVLLGLENESELCLAQCSPEQAQDILRKIEDAKLTNLLGNRDE